MKKLRPMIKVARVLRGHCRGMTLVEVLLALFVIGVVAIVFLGGLASAARAVLLADVRTTAESLARTQMEYVKNQAYNDQLVNGYASYSKTDYVPYGYTVWSVDRDGDPIQGGHNDPIAAFPWDSDTDDYATEETGLQKVTLRIEHEGERIFTLEGYKLDR